MPLKNKKILVGLTGGIACYKVPYLVRALRKADAEVQIVMTEAATKFITPLTMETVSGNPVVIKMFEDRDYTATRHIDLAGWADLIMIAPATANFMAKISSGICDDLLTTIICASSRPILIAPAMNPQMWKNQITQRNCKTLKTLGYRFINPAEGEMACDHVGIGRMQEPETLFEAINNFFKTSQNNRSSKKKA